MALLQPFVSDKFVCQTQQFSHSKPNTSPGRSSTVVSLYPPLSKPYLNPRFYSESKKPWMKCRAVAEQVGDKDVLLGGSNQEKVKQESGPMKYGWTEEWYPLYLNKNVPDDAPLGLTVFDKQLVLYRDGNGEIRCFEDRCPHRLLPHSMSL